VASAAGHQRKLIGKIDAALQRIDDGTYGYCEETGEPISLRRLEARAIATCRSRPRRATNSANASIATIDCHSAGFAARIGLIFGDTDFRGG
jgi:hypothetical protein